jgi:hypothetical protein
MSFKRIGLLALLLVASLVMAACGGDDDNGGNGGDVNLSQTYDAEGLTFNYPEGWVSTSGSDGAIVASSQEALDLMESEEESEVPEGASAVMVFAIAGVEDLGMGAEDFIGLISSEAASEEGTTVTDPEEVTVGEASGLKSMVSSSSIKGDGAVYVFLPDANTLVAVVAMSREGQYDDALTMRIAETVRYTAPADE